jgi:DNA adenine methylase
VQRGLAVTLDTRYDEKLFYSHRARFNRLVNHGGARSSEAAQLFYYLNRTCYNGLCRFNQRNEFNVPFGKYKTVNYATTFLPYRNVFRHWKFTNIDLEKLEVRDDDFIYADPPYDVEFTTYSAGGFVWDDQVRTAEWLAKHRGPVLLSNQATPRIIQLYRRLGFRLKFFDAPRRISSDGDSSARARSTRQPESSLKKRAERFRSAQVHLLTTGNYFLMRESIGSAGLLGGASGSPTACPAGEMPCEAISCAV